MTDVLDRSHARTDYVRLDPSRCRMHTCRGNVDCRCRIRYYILNTCIFHVFTFYFNDSFNKTSESCLVESSSLLMRRRRTRSKRTERVNKIIQKREEHGEFHRIMDALKKFREILRLLSYEFKYVYSYSVNYQT